MARRRNTRGPWFWRGAIGAMLTGVFGLFALVAFSQPPAVMPEMKFGMYGLSRNSSMMTRMGYSPSLRPRLSAQEVSPSIKDATSLPNAWASARG